MSFQPILLSDGFSGWSFLKRTQASQKQVFNATPQMQRDIDYFRENITKVNTASDLVSDRRLLRVALGAFDLDGDISNKYFIEKILTEGTSDPRSLANKMGDKRYAGLSSAFGFEKFAGPNTQRTGFAADIINRYQDKRFEIAVGALAPNLRVALNLEQGLVDATKDSQSNDAHWFRVMGTPPLRKAFESALGLPSSIGKLDIDQQLGQFKSRSRKVFGTDKVAEINTAEGREDLAQKFLLRADLQAFSAQTQKMQTASMLLSQIRFPDNSLF